MKIAKAMHERAKSITPDMGAINQFAVSDLTADDVYCFSAVLCDSEIDRDMERFTSETLDDLAKMFVGKTVIFDHTWSAKNQVARIYSCEVVEQAEKNMLGEPLKQLVGKAYILNTEENKSIIDAIDGGILSEVSVGCSVRECVCSVCGEAFEFDWDTWTLSCKNGHVKGESYDGTLCCGELKGAADAYELSFVAVPAQKGAGVIKSASDVQAAIDTILGCESIPVSACEKLLKKIKAANTSREEMAKRKKILEANKKYIKENEE